MSTEMKNTRLIQRLKKPGSGVPFEHYGMKDNPFSFGGGLKNGGLSDKAMDLIRGIFSFDYMGAAEFEFGAVPEAMSRIAESNLTAFSFSIPRSKVEKNWRDKSNETPVGEATVYVLCPVEHATEIEARIRSWAKKEPAYPYDFKERSGLQGALRPYEKWDTDICGWLELNNGFLFFTDQEMWEKSCSLFGVTPTV